VSADDDTSRGWKIDRLFEQLDEDVSGSLDEQELFIIMKMVADARYVRVSDKVLRNDVKMIIHEMSNEVQGKIVLKEFQRYAATYPEKFKDIIRLRNVFQKFYDPVTDTMDYEAMTKLVAEVKKKKFQSTLDVEELYRRFGNGSSEHFTFEMFTEMYHGIEDFSLLEEFVPRKQTAGPDEEEEKDVTIRKKACAPEGCAAGEEVPISPMPLHRAAAAKSGLAKEKRPEKRGLSNAGLTADEVMKDLDALLKLFRAAT
jgi:Ca2+-binding EF-hand superfamily protein